MGNYERKSSNITNVIHGNQDGSDHIDRDVQHRIRVFGDIRTHNTATTAGVITTPSVENGI